MAEIFYIYNTYLAPATNALLDLGSDALEFKDLWIDGISYIDTLEIHNEINFIFYEGDLVSYDEEVVFYA